VQVVVFVEILRRSVWGASVFGWEALSQWGRLVRRGGGGTGASDGHLLVCDCNGEVHTADGRDSGQ